MKKSLLSILFVLTVATHCAAQWVPLDKTYFLDNVGTCAGCQDNAAHHMIDYEKVWDVPSDMEIPDYLH